MVRLGWDEFEDAATLYDDVELAGGIFAKTGDRSSGAQRGPIGQFCGLSRLVAEAPNPALTIICKEVETLQGWNGGASIDVAPDNRATLVVRVLKVGRDETGAVTAASVQAVSPFHD